jgi:hypothetical protein
VGLTYWYGRNQGAREFWSRSEQVLETPVTTGLRKREKNGWMPQIPKCSRDLRGKDKKGLVNLSHNLH